MSPQNLFVATVALSLVNGLISPALPIMMALWPVWMPEMLRPSNETIFYGASLLVSTGTLLLSGLPAAVAERAGLGLDRAMWVWLGTAGLLLLLGLG
ncbi:hypothetical protein [Falsiroseomonas oryzae]|uniref:hypothetical protein n=1 Tax=Falsiroseomonas oryzae TaxID=2766473 RepID=UPI0022EA9654|nr:hypothetical protein [Roseomonas sp. MO-31]